MKRLFIVSAILLSMFSTCFAQEDETSESKIEFNAGADLVSSYVWRGQHLSSCSFQPSLGFSVGGFSLGTWGSVDFNGESNEFDWVAAYSFDKIGLTIGLTDYYGLYHGVNLDGSIGEGDFLTRYGTYDNHILEVNAGLDFASFCDKFAMTISANVNVVNDDDYSTYIELGYPVKVKSVDVDFALGLTPAEGAYSTGFNIVNLSVKGSKTLDISPKFQLPVFAQAVINPNSEQASLVFGITF